MRPETWMESLLGNRWRVRVLRRLLRDPGRIWTERELAKALGGSPNTVNLTVGALRDAGVLEFRRLGRSNTFRLRSDLTLLQRLGTVFAQETDSWEDVRKAIQASVPKGVACVLFGSTARGEAHEASDVDLLVVAPTLDEAEDAAATIRQAVATTFPLELAIASLGVKELRKKRNEPWLRNALAEGQSLSRTAVGAVA